MCVLYMVFFITFNFQTKLIIYFLIMRTSHRQFQLMITYMEQHGDLSKSCTNLDRRIAVLKHWKELTILMNNDGSGDSKNTEKWKKVWSDFKNNTKKKAARLQRASNRPGERVVVHTKLTDLEKRVLILIGANCTTGLANNEEGFLQDVNNVQDVSAPSFVPSPISATEDMQLELKTEQGDQDAAQTQLVTLFIQHDDGSIEGTEVFSEPSSISSVVDNVNGVEPQVRPAQTGQTHESSRPVQGSSKRLSRSTRRLLGQRSKRPTGMHWREFKMRQHEDNMEIKREENRIRELEVQTQRDWQTVGLRVLDILDKLVTRYCRH